MACLEQRFGSGRIWQRSTKYFEREDVSDEVAVAVFLGMRDHAPDFLRVCNELAIPNVVIDLGWMRRERGYWQASVGGLNVAPKRAPSSDRFEELDLKVYAPKTPQTNFVLVGQVPGDAQHDLTTERAMMEWGRGTATAMKAFIGPRKRVMWRPHPLFRIPLGPPAVTTWPERPLLEFLKEEHVGGAVVYNSTAALDMLRVGVHVVAQGPRTVYTDLVPREVGRLFDAHPGPERVRSLLEKLAYGQYKIEELATWATFQRLFELHDVTGDW